MSRLRRSRLLFAAFVILVLAGIYGVAGLRHPAKAAAAPPLQSGRAAVTSAVRACAAPGSAGVMAGSLAIASVPGSAAHGTAVATRLVPGGSATQGPTVATASQPGVGQLTKISTAPPLTKALATAQPGSSAKVSTQAARGGVVVRATGALAQGLDVEQTGQGGLVTADCQGPGTSFWFLGPGQASAANIQLYLMNTDAEAADVQVTAITDINKGGPLLGNADNGITVPPHAMVVQSLGSLLQSSKVVALNVSTSVGRVVAQLRESRTSAHAGGWLPQAQAPARNLVIPGLPKTSGSPTLYLAVPGTATAAVKVTAVSSRGSYQPTGGTGIDLLPGSITALPLPALTGITGALRITASVPVVASVLVSGGPAGTPGAFGASAGPVQEQGVLADNPVGSAGSTSLILSAPRAAASVRVVVSSAGAPVSGASGTVVQIKAGGSIVVPVKAPAGHRTTAVLVVISPLSGSGPVYAGRVIRIGNAVQSILAVPSSLTWVPLPSVRSSLAAVTP